MLNCPHQRGIVYYPHARAIVEHDLTTPNSQPKSVADLTFIPNSLSTLVLPTGDTLLAAGGQEAELYLALFASSPSSPSSSASPSSHLVDEDGRLSSRHLGRRRWQLDTVLPNASINNSVYLTRLDLCRSNESSIDPRLMVSNNDRTVKFFDIALRKNYHTDSGVPNAFSSGLPTKIPSVGELRLDVPVNHCTYISPTFAYKYSPLIIVLHFPIHRSFNLP